MGVELGGGQVGGGFIGLLTATRSSRRMGWLWARCWSRGMCASFHGARDLWWRTGRRIEQNFFAHGPHGIHGRRRSRIGEGAAAILPPRGAALSLEMAVETTDRG